MKNIYFRRTFFFLLISLVTVLSCKKTETITVEEPDACFSILVNDPWMSYQMAGSAASIDSSFYFKNCSDSGANITYRWSFGDGAVSKDKNPKHAYTKRGNYIVTLVVSNNDMAFDTIQKNVSVALGQQHLSLGEGVNLSPVAVEETTANEFVLLAASNYGAAFHLYKLDSLMKQTNVKNFPASYRLNSMKFAGDGNYILTGSTQDATKTNELIKITTEGNVLWNKSFSSTDGYIYAAPTPDGGYAVLGGRPTPGPYGNMTHYGVVIKTDNNGNPQWQKVFDQEGMLYASEAVVEQDGIVIAGVKKATASPCWECDSVLIVKLNNSGSVVWKNTVVWGLNTTNWWNTRISKLSNGNYAVNNEYTKGIFIFSPSGSFLDRKLATGQVKTVVSSEDGSLIVLQSESGNGNRIGILKLGLDGATLWNTYPEGRQKMGTGYSCCSSSWPVAMRPLRNGGVLVVGYRILNTTSYNIYSNVLLLQLDDAGKAK